MTMTRSKQSGSVIIIVLWTAVLLTVLVTAMAGKVRLSAQTASHNRDASWEWAQLMAAVNFAEAELMLARMAADRSAARRIGRRRVIESSLPLRRRVTANKLSIA